MPITWPAVLFVGGLVVSTGLSRVLARNGRAGYGIAAVIRVAAWLVAVTPLIGTTDLRMLVATLGFGLMAGMMRRAVYRRLLESTPDNMPPVRLRADLRPQLHESAMLAGIVGGHVVLLFAVAFLRTASVVVFRAWWEIVPALAILGTLGFNLAVRPLTDKVLTGLRIGPQGDPEELRAALAQARAVPRRLSRLNFVVWALCVSFGIFYLQPGPEVWNWPDAVMQVFYGALFAWGVSFYQRFWHKETLAPIVRRLEQWTGELDSEPPRTLQQRLLREFGLPLAFTSVIALLSSISLYRSLASDLSTQEDLNAITALSASFVLLAIAVGGVFVRAARQLSEPLSELAKAADQVASGHLDAAVPNVRGPLEMITLRRSLEHMRRTLARTIADLEEERAGLETNVELRTAELRAALDELKQAQAALVQGERMALLGELVAGVAHEVNNPLNAIAGSISSLSRVEDELTDMLTAYRQAEAHLPAAERQALADKREALDVEGALDDLAGVAKVVRSATQRSVEIVGNLRRFARAPGEAVPASLDAGLEETLSLLRHRLADHGIDVTIDDTPLPEVVCRPGEINQVFMNVLSNAIAAPARSTIAIRKRVQGDRVVVEIADDGPGVPEGLRTKIFDPFFTTKARGEGTGLGLSISADILRRHGGRLSVDIDHELEGACFRLELPRAPDERPNDRPSPPTSGSKARSGTDVGQLP
ncbi:MAG TPA: HAMP domain-containing sensor histidine kinase [Polyangiaceae bacterium]|nr:HAMP domain-containing sensor histidine kinase [Polyangiaceae bacterium]